MITRLLFFCLVAGIAYYAGYQQLTHENIGEWLEEQDFSQTLKDTYEQILDLAEENQVAEKAGEVIEDLKEKVAD